MSQFKLPEDWYSNWSVCRAGTHYFFEAFVRRIESLYNFNHKLPIPIVLDIKDQNLEGLFTQCVKYIQSTLKFNVCIFV